jgi:hypothetical protein
MSGVSGQEEARGTPGGMEAWGHGERGRQGGDRWVPGGGRFDQGDRARGRQKGVRGGHGRCMVTRRKSGYSQRASMWVACGERGVPLVVIHITSSVLCWAATLSSQAFRS